MILLALLAQAIAAPPSEPTLKACADIDPGSPYITFERDLVRAGDTVRIKPMVNHAWFGNEEVRWDCFDRWAVSDPKLARLDATRGALIIAADAPADSIVTVTAAFRPTEIIPAMPRRAELKIVARKAQVLTGRWTEMGRENCVGESVDELIFRPGGGYSFTFSSMMIETMTSGGGAFSWNPVDGRLTLGSWTGVARLGRRPASTAEEFDMLVVSGIDFTPRSPLPPGPDGMSPPQRPCMLTFRRARD